MAKRSLEEEADFVWDVGWTLSQPHKGSVFDLDVVELKESNVLGHYLRAKKIFVRPCYKTLFPQIWMLLEHSGVAILGTAGIGKSLFGVLILIEVLRLLRQKNAIWLAAGLLFMLPRLITLSSHKMAQFPNLVVRSVVPWTLTSRW